MFRIGTALTPLIALLIATAAVGAEDRRTRDQRFLDERARTVESSLKDLSNRNDDGLGSIRATPRPTKRAFDGERSQLAGQDVPSAEALVSTDVASSLHRLRREAVSRQTPDNRKARIDASLHRQATEMPDRAGPSSASSPVEIHAPEFASLRDERFDLRPDDAPAKLRSDRQPVGSSLHQLRRSEEAAEEEPDSASETEAPDQ
jgi:hypothetical protein